MADVINKQVLASEKFIEDKLKNINADSVDGKHVWVGTKAEYRVLQLNGTIDESTLYIYEDPITKVTSVSINGSDMLDDNGLIRSELLPDNIKLPGKINADTVDGYHLWSGTQAEYDTIDTKDDNTIYIITDYNDTRIDNLTERVGKLEQITTWKSF